ncbi:MAG: DinB family protein [Chloroflexota bacterium]
MSNQILLERFTRPLFELLDETFEHVHGAYLDEGTSLFETIEPVSAEQASRAASDQVATIAAQVKHVRFYLDVLQDYVLNKNVGRVDWGEIWRTTRQVTPEEWETLKRELKETYESVLATLKNLDSWEGENNISGALGILAHTAYHLGEIRQALGVIAPSQKE